MSSVTFTPTLEQTFFRQSQSIAKLAEALARAHGEFGKVGKSAENPFFKSSYADMATVIAATRPALSKYGLSIIQSPRSTLAEGQRCVVVSTMLVHSSGEWISDELAVPIEKTFTAQSVGSAVTYARRYALQAFLCVAGEDDDGNAASGTVRTAEDEKAFELEFDKRTEGQEALAPFQIIAIDEACKKTGKSEDEIKAYLGLIGVKDQRIEHVLRADFPKFLQWANGKALIIPKPPPYVSGKEVAAAVLKPPTVKSYDHAWPKLYAKAKEKNIPQEDVKRFYTEQYGVTGGAELTPLQFAEVLKWVSEVG